jgi:hypothetical protein
MLLPEFSCRQVTLPAPDPPTQLQGFNPSSDPLQKLSGLDPASPDPFLRFHPRGFSSEHLVPAFTGSPLMTFSTNRSQCYRLLAFSVLVMFDLTFYP